MAAGTVSPNEIQINTERNTEQILHTDNTDLLIAGARRGIRDKYMWQGEVTTRITFDWFTKAKVLPGRLYVLQAWISE